MMGATIEVREDKQDEIEIMLANHVSFEAFLACETQWRAVGTMAGIFWQGLDYPAVRIVLDDIDAPKHVFADIRVMEAAALPILNERDD